MLGTHETVLVLVLVMGQTVVCIRPSGKRLPCQGSTHCCWYAPRELLCKSYR